MGKRHPARKGGGGPPFVQLYHYTMATPAWLHLDPVARALYIELKSHYNGSNNGSIGLGARQAGKALGVHPATAARAFRRLEDHGFIVAVTKGVPRRGSGYNLATEWLLTEAYDNRRGAAASKNFLTWKPDHVAPEQRENSLAVANSEDHVALVQRDGSHVPQKEPSRRTSATSKPDLAETTSHQCDTLTSSHRQQVPAQRDGVAPPSIGGAYSDGEQAGGPVQIGAALASSPIIQELQGAKP